MIKILRNYFINLINYFNKRNETIIGRPRLSNEEDIAKLLFNKKNITCLTGAGISAASGIPTFRGDNGFWKSKPGTRRNFNIKNII